MSEEKSFQTLEIDQFLSFKDEKTHIITFDPGVRAKLFTGGQFGDSWAVPVDLNGEIRWLRIKSKRLHAALKKIKQRSNRSTLRITKAPRISTI